jgi:hypothetical protein
MKCPKCNYISFDYNQTCPKCNRDIASEQKRLNLPPYESDPPFLLASLAGGVDGTTGDLQVGDLETTMEIQRQMRARQEETILQETGDILNDSVEDLDVALDSENTGLSEELLTGPVLADERVETGIQFKEEPPVVKLDDDEPSFSFSEKDLGEEDIALDLEELDTAPHKPDDKPFVSPKGKRVGGGAYDEAEMMTLEIEAAKESGDEEMEDFDLELDLEELEEKLQ